MLTMGILYETMKQHGSLQMDRMEFLTALMPKDMSSLQELRRLLLGQDSYKSNFFKGKLSARGLTTPVRDILDELTEQPDEWMNQIAGKCTYFLQVWGSAKGSSTKGNGAKVNSAGASGTRDEAFAACLENLAPHIREEQVLYEYVSRRTGKPECYADILTVLYLYCMTLWKKTRYLNFLADRYQNGMAEGWTFSLDRAEFYASCGKEKTIFKTGITEENGIRWLDVKMNFAPALVRPEIPDWCSVVIKMKPPRDIRYFHSFVFLLEPVEEEPGKGCGLARMDVELHSAGHAMEYRHQLSMGQSGVSMVPLKGVNLDLLKNFEELCFVAHCSELTGLEAGDLSKLQCHFRIAQIRLN